MQFLRIEAFLLLPLVLLLFRGRLASRGLVYALRFLVLLLLCAVLARPYSNLEEAGRDLILVFDASRSIPGEAKKRYEELATLAKEQQQKGDRIGLVRFARRASVDAPQTESFALPKASKDYGKDATDLAAAIDTALGMIPEGRQGSLLLVSDGEFTGREPYLAARAALRRGVRIDTIPLRRKGTHDLAAQELRLPRELSAKEPFQFSAFVRSDRRVEAGFRLLRDGKLLARGKRIFSAGSNRLIFHDRFDEPGTHRYELLLDAPGDRVAENNHARGVLRAVGPQRILCLTPGGREDRLTRSLRLAGLEVVTKAPEAAELSLGRLDSFAAVILENVMAASLPPGGMQKLALYVRELGGGLLMTGGKSSFGPGGYYKSPLEEVLPVTMEIRKEQRKFHLAMAVALDRSGSMMASAGGGLRKMDLANQGTIAAIELLSALDSVSVIAVDSAAHVVVPMSRLTEKPSVLDRVARIESRGGGIFVGEALHEAATQLAAAEQSNRHIVLFADAADSERPDDYKTFIPKLRKAGVTISVIGLGSKKDSDAALLEEVASLGGGRVFFVKEAAELPRVFAQETIQVARSSLVEVPTKIEANANILAIGALRPKALPEVGGYSIAYARPMASISITTKDEQSAPMLATWQAGLGRSATFLGEADGKFSGPFGSWSGYGDFFATLTRWIAGSRADERLFAKLEREGHEAVLRIEVEEGREKDLLGLEARLLDPSGKARSLRLEKRSEQSLEARFPLSEAGNFWATIQSKGAILRPPPLTLPYSPEFELRQDPRFGERCLARIARITNGRVDPPAAASFEGPRKSRGMRELGLPFFLILLLLFLTEILVRRLDLRVPAVITRAGSQLLTGALKRFEKKESQLEAPRRKQRKKPQAKKEAPSPAPEEEKVDLGTALQRAKDRSRRR